MTPLLFGSRSSAVAMPLSILACEDAIAYGELRVLQSDWEAVRGQFSGIERDALREKILIEMLSPRGWYLSLAGLDAELGRKLVYALHAVDGLRKAEP